MKIMKTSKNGIEFIKKYEGFVATPYDDGYGNMTVGWGHKMTKLELEDMIARKLEGERVVRTIDGEEVVLTGYEELLHEDIKEAEKAVNSLVDQSRFDLLQHEYDAIISLVFNIGEDAFKDSNTLKLINEWHWGGCKEAELELRREWGDGMHGFVKANGEYSNGLFHRRQMELLVFFDNLYKI